VELFRKILKGVEMKKFIVKLLINGVALYAAIAIMQGRGITPQSNNWIDIAWLALIFSLVNSLIRPILLVVGCPFIILTLGLGVLMVNTLMFYLAGVIGTNFGVGFTVAGFWPAFWGAMIVSAISFILNIFIKDDRNK